jgi:hypothetical protein
MSIKVNHTRAIMSIRPIAAAAALLGSMAACSQAPEQPASNDGRTPLSVDINEADAVRAEMRTMLGSLNAMLTALPARDTAALRNAALAAGMAAAADTALEHLLPEEFLRLGVSVHQQFDGLGLALAGGLSPDSVLPRLAKITADCVACHTLYRLEPRAGH